MLQSSTPDPVTEKLVHFPIQFPKVVGEINTASIVHRSRLLTHQLGIVDGRFAFVSAGFSAIS